MAEKSSDGQGQIITTAQAGALLMLGAERVRQLIKQGFIKKAGRDQVRLVSAVQGYITFLKDEERRSSKGAAESRVRDARAAAIELQNAERRRLLVSQEDVLAILDTTHAAVRSEIEGLPSRITRDLALRREVQREVDDCLARIAEKLEAAGRSLAEGGDILPPE